MNNMLTSIEVLDTDNGELSKKKIPLVAIDEAISKTGNRRTH